ncbi:hypothetical protein C5167_010322 [Papaver somniferum]|uniref:Uncharacterized protein n=1 Tax=Papaver somniferum TaxID=3469 RepID=A0A4Y7K404_PAPSO|nr:uncharacterized protein LOC113288850 [Papaver somniferum]RZC66639.1 hypothetical protein C5167_010322 [Papaver somniferum]
MDTVIAEKKKNKREEDEQERSHREEDDDDDEQEYEEVEQEFGSRIIIHFVKRIYEYVSNPANGSVFLPEGGFMFHTSNIEPIQSFSCWVFQLKDQPGFRIKTIRDGPKRYVNPRFKENDESVFEINVKAIKTLVDAAGEVDSVRRDQVSASEKVAESLLMLREIRVPGLHEEGRDAIYIEFLRSWQSQWKKTERSQEGCVTLEMVCCKFNFWS